MPMSLAVTGANGNLGRRLIAQIGGGVRALVRRQAAARQLREAHPDLDIRVLDYLDPQAMTEALDGIEQVAHLVGIIKETSRSSYLAAHEQTTAALVEAMAASGVRSALGLSILGADPASANPCLASRGRADRLLLNGPVPATVIRVPMVLGEGDYAARALRRRAAQRLGFAFRAASLEQPIYAGDLIAALQRALRQPSAQVLDLAGPETLTRGALHRRAAAVLGRKTATLSLPLGLGLAAARLLEWLPNPPVTRAMLGVLNQDDQVDMANCGIDLTPLDETLRRVLRSP